MEQMPTEHEPRFNRDLFREDQAAFLAMFADEFEPGDEKQAELANHLQMVEHVFSHVPILVPEDGFTRRWEKTLRRRRRRERLRWFLSISLSLAVVLFTLSALIWSELIASIKQWVVVGISMFFTSPELIDLVLSFRDGIIRVGRVLYPGLLVIPAGFMLWGMIWGISLFYLMTTRKHILRYGLQR